MNSEVIETNKRYIKKSIYIIIAYGIFHMIVALSFFNDKDFSGAPAGQLVIWGLIIVFSYITYRYLSIISGVVALLVLLLQLLAMIGINANTETIIDLILIVILTTTLYRIYKHKKYILNSNN
ncbi:hypothetical protein [Sulfurimonas sp.]|jgi:hypothetical protein|uniref:hypothetical protein n=1 Tax=Sulfurimonas sp. TaxID=2022749 RepID=UPI0025EB06CF|nr:hypothetical protein [Sulfurimonas sp.]MBT5935702.1 hypothetical protein [Sulfurimonas sp.]